MVVRWRLHTINLFEDWLATRVDQTKFMCGLASPLGLVWGLHPIWRMETLN
jgi:hypothetical protein